MKRVLTFSGYIFKNNKDLIKQSNKDLDQNIEQLEKNIDSIINIIKFKLEIVKSNHNSIRELFIEKKNE